VPRAAGARSAPGVDFEEFGDVVHESVDGDPAVGGGVGVTGRLGDGGRAGRCAVVQGVSRGR